MKAIQSLFEQQNETVVLSSSYRTANTAPLKEYARLLATLCNGTNNSTLRTAPFEFEWTFQALMCNLSILVLIRCIGRIGSIRAGPIS